MQGVGRRALELGFVLQGVGCRDAVCCRVQGVGCRVRGVGCGVWGVGCGVCGERDEVRKMQDVGCGMWSVPDTRRSRPQTKSTRWARTKASCAGTSAHPSHSGPCAA